MSVKKQRKVLELLDFTAFLWYNSFMKNTANVQTSNTEMVSISRAEYERFQAQGERISALESRLNNSWRRFDFPERSCSVRPLRR